MNSLNTINRPQVDLFSWEYTNTIISKASSEIDIENRIGEEGEYPRRAQAQSGQSGLCLTAVYGGPNLNGAGKQLRSANGNVKDKFSSEGREQIPAHPSEREALFSFQRNRRIII